MPRTPPDDEAGGNTRRMGRVTAMTTETLHPPVTAGTTAPPTEPRASRQTAWYWRRWKNVLPELGYLIPAGVIAWVVFTFLIWALSAAAGLIIIFIGVILVPLTLLGARYLGRFELLRMRGARMPAIAEPRYPTPFRGKTFGRSLADIAANPHDWLAYVHGVVLFPLVATVTNLLLILWGTVTVTLLATPIVLTLRPFDQDTVISADGWPRVSVGDWSVGDALTFYIQRQPDDVLATWIAVLAFVGGLVLLAALPLLTRGLTWAHWGADRLLLARFPSEQVNAEVAAIDDSRRAAVVAEDLALRRLERDIHDGPQQRLLRLQLDLASAERRLADDPAAAGELLTSARLLAKDTLDELRALTRGFAPPILQDRGLAAALESLGGQSAIAIDTSIRLEDASIPSEVERGAYFVAAELLSNAVKHSGATRIGLAASVVPVAGPAAFAPADSAVRRELLLEVTDDGHGGALLVPGHGLAGLSERVLGMRGTLAIDSPDGGPTSIRVLIPLPAEALESATDGSDGATVTDIYALPAKPGTNPEV
jgi:signal transduction histidine kinase